MPLLSDLESRQIKYFGPPSLEKQFFCNTFNLNPKLRKNVEYNYFVCCVPELKLSEKKKCFVRSKWSTVVSKEKNHCVHVPLFTLRATLGAFVQTWSWCSIQWLCDKLHLNVHADPLEVRMFSPQKSLLCTAALLASPVSRY